MILAELVHDQMRTRTAVINISKDMQPVYDQHLYQLGQHDDKFLRAPQFHDRIDDCLIIRFLVEDLRLLGDQLLDHIGIILRQRLTHLGSCVF